MNRLSLTYYKLDVIVLKFFTMGIETIDIRDEKGIQAIRIPKNLKINDNKVYLKKVGNALFIIPFHDPWQNLFESLDLFTSDYLDDRGQQINQNRESFE